MLLAILSLAASMMGAAPSAESTVDVPLVASKTPTPTFEAKISGKTRHFILDTANSAGIISSRLVKELGLAPNGGGTASDSSANNGRPVSVYELNGLVVGGQTFDHIPVVSGPEGQDTGPLGKVDGVLALNSFGGRVITIDFAGRRLRIGKRRLDAQERSHSFKFRSDRGCPIVTARIGNERFPVRLDTGSEMGLLLPTSYLKKLPLKSKPANVGSFRTMLNQFSIEQATVAGAVEVAGRRLNLDRVLFSDAFPVPNLGSGAMSKLSLTISPSESRIVIR